jgi:hypothetical protein
MADLARKKKSKKKELTAKEKLDKLIKEGKILSRPIYEGDTELKEEKLSIMQKTPMGYATVGTSNGMTFSADPNARTSDWFRKDVFVSVYAKPESIDEVMKVLDDYLVDKLADYYESIVELNED